ncbi:MAG: phosphate ABC transporter permease PstA [Desulfomonile tiedjei]|uniref:Phosphate transport system permease protein PstA n=1 Tax=Desulfomonile tiedjei TaxID=2358 RepID=A0A9D6V5K5_9BACT|nr:phosphate ABC transporter permease PstA [Desulfomonile tiedjei]
MSSEDGTTAEPRPKRSMIWDFKARGEPFLWGLGGALAIGMLMIAGFIVLILYKGVPTFYPEPIEVMKLRDGSVVAGEVTRVEKFAPGTDILANLDDKAKEAIAAKQGLAGRTLLKTGNFDLYHEDYRWVNDYEVAEVSEPAGIYMVERMEWGPFIGTIVSLNLQGDILDRNRISPEILRKEQAAAARRRERIREIERTEIAAVNQHMEDERLKLRKTGLSYGQSSSEYQRTEAVFKENSEKLEVQYQDLAKEAVLLKERDSKYAITLADAAGREQTIKLSDIVRFYPANDLTVWKKLEIYFSRWWEFLTQEPREANTEGGVMPAIFGTFCMTVLMALTVAPFGVVAALYLREYAKQGRMVSLVRICVNNLAGVPSIVYGVFGLGFFAYVLGGSIDQMLFPERLPTPTFGTGGLLWSSLTLALLTVPVVIVATEEALAAVPGSMREGSLACGASKWQTIKWIVLPRAMPGIMTGLILAMARGAGEVAPLMLVGVVKMAPELPIDQFFPYIHLERSFMHLGFHIYDVGFQSRNSEAAKPMVFVTTLLLIGLVFAMNAASIMIRNRLKRKFFMGHF